MPTIGRFGNMRVAHDANGSVAGFAPIEKKTVEIRGVNGAIGNRPPTARFEKVVERVWVPDPITGEVNSKVVVQLKEEWR